MSGFELDSVEVIWRDNDLAFSRRSNAGPAGNTRSVLVLQPVSEHAPHAAIELLTNEFELKSQLSDAWAVLPLAVQQGDRPTLIFSDPGGAPLEDQLGLPMDAGRFLRLAIRIVTAVEYAHQHGLVHKNLKPTNILVDCDDGNARLTGFGIASRLPQERQTPRPPELLAGTLAYMPPEQTGRMNRSVDARSDLYSLGVIFYRMLTGHLPFSASDPMAWIHCHVARVPDAPIDKVSSIPAVLSRVVIKLLAKTAEERYQTANGLKWDLAECLAEWDAKQRIDDFLIGAHDISDRLLIPEKLYGREREIDTLISAFTRVVTHSRSELVLVSGYSGVGKSSLVHELHKVLVPPRGLFASGKFDRNKCDVPYWTVAQALQGLLRQILGKSDSEMSGWRSAMLEALGSNGALLLSLLPQLEAIIGPQPSLPPLGAQEEQERFHTVFLRFLGVFARKEHPLALFLDDLQWLDSATLKLLEHLVCHAEVNHVLLIGAYRDNEVDLSHPLTAILESMRRKSASVSEVRLSPLAPNDVVQLVADAIVSGSEKAAPLASLVHEKSAGNPFFTIQFLSELEEDGLLECDKEASQWRWDLEQIRTRRFTDNVVDLMLSKLARLPDVTREALKRLACLGSRSALATMTMVHGGAIDAVRAELWDAQRAGLVRLDDGTYTFVHDRVQEAAYSLIPEAERPAFHLRIGRLLLRQMSASELNDQLFEVVNQLNAGVALIEDKADKLQLAELNLRAARRAKASTAYVSARTHLVTAASLLDESAWETHHPVAFAVSLERAECEFLCGSHEVADQLLTDLFPLCDSKTEIASAYRIRIEVNVFQSRFHEAVQCLLDCLRIFEIEMPANPTRSEIEHFYEDVCRNIDGRSIESLIDLPAMVNAEMQAVMRVLSNADGPIYFTNFNLLCPYLCVMVNISLKYGHTEASPQAYVWFGLVLGPVFQRYVDGYRFGELACNLVEKYDLRACSGRTYFVMSMLTLWTQPVAKAIGYVRMALQAGTETGDLTISCYSGNHLVTDLILQGAPLDQVWQESERALAFASKARFRDVVDAIVGQQRFIATMQGKTDHGLTFNDHVFDELAFEATLTPDRMATMVCCYWIIKLQARCIFGDFEAALILADKARPLLSSIFSHIQLLDYHYYTALALSGAYDDAQQDRKATLLDQLTGHLSQFRLWAGHCSATFRDKHALIEAEYARIEGRTLDAQRLYEDAVRLAREGGFVQNQAIASELAAKFHTTLGLSITAMGFARNARNCFARWGATAKVQALDETYTGLSEERGEVTAAHTIERSIDSLDLSTVLKVSQAVSGEIVLEKLIATLLQTSIEHAGAVRGVLLLAQDSDLRLRAEAVAYGNSLGVKSLDESLESADLPETIIRYAARTGDLVLIDDASASSDFSGDGYVSRTRARSVLCLPLIRQGRTIALLYLENNLSAGVFTAQRVAVLNLLSSEAATALENSILYGELQTREFKIRRLVDANIVGIFFWDLDGEILDANDAFLEIIGYDRDDLTSGRLNWERLTPAEWLHIDKQRIAPELESTGTVQPFEKEYFRKDGSRVSVMIAAATYGEGFTRGVGFVLDLTERKRAEASMRKTQLELEHANRVASLGQLTASIAHEVRQPITASINNALAARNWLNSNPPDLSEVRALIEAIIRNGTRAGEVIRRVHDLVKKEPRRSDQVDINSAILEVVDFARHEASKQKIDVRIFLAEHLPKVSGDRVQLQQLFLNLTMNAIEALSEVEPDRRVLSIATAEKTPGEMLVSFQDSGPGLPSDSAELVFDPFFTTKANGLGMGLSICHSIVDAHEGRIWAEETASEGVVFQVSLPVSQE